jgi:hypothetical protein
MDDMMSTDYGRLTSILLGVCRNMNARIEQLEAQLAAKRSKRKVHGLINLYNTVIFIKFIGKNKFCLI